MDHVLKALDEHIAHLEWLLKNARQEADELRDENDRVKSQNSKLLTQNAALEAEAMRLRAATADRRLPGKPANAGA